MTDVLHGVRDQVRDQNAEGLTGHELGTYYVATIHRPDNTDDPERLRAILAALARLDRSVVLLAHPRLLSIAERYGLSLEQGVLTVREPLPYPQLVAAVMGSAGVVTDSGGLQKEAFLLRVPATTVRPETEWVETVDLGWNVLANETEDIVSAVTRPAPAPTLATPYGDGHAAAAAVTALLETAAQR